MRSDSLKTVFHTVLSSPGKIRTAALLLGTMLLANTIAVAQVYDPEQYPYQQPKLNVLHFPKTQPAMPSAKPDASALPAKPEKPKVTKTRQAKNTQSEKSQPNLEAYRSAMDGSVPPLPPMPTNAEDAIREIKPVPKAPSWLAKSVGTKRIPALTTELQRLEIQKENGAILSAAHSKDFTILNDTLNSVKLQREALEQEIVQIGAKVAPEIHYVSDDDSHYENGGKPPKTVKTKEPAQ